LALGTTAPLWSTTRPLIVPLEDCALALHDIQQIANAHSAMYKSRLPQTEARRLPCVPLVESLRFAVNPILSMIEIFFMALPA